MIYGIPPEIVNNFSSGFETWSTPSRQVDVVQPLNVAKPPFDDPKVRQATSLTIDRASLLKASLDGQGTVATGMFPPIITAAKKGKVVGYAANPNNQILHRQHLRGLMSGQADSSVV